MEIEHWLHGLEAKGNMCLPPTIMLILLAPEMQIQRRVCTMEELTLSGTTSTLGIQEGREVLLHMQDSYSMILLLNGKITTTS